ncbi:unnamed protein product [Lymnaea stagnalis]|uniref:PARG catalytic Macro domain-containing protein n=1 Tax=Lymnaea stagnalis TaxID=6523 RepID=A0AAV2IEQ9_LYMST
MPCDINAMPRLESDHVDQQIPTAGFPTPFHSSALAGDSAVRHDFLGMRLASDILGNLTKITSTADGAEASLLPHAAQGDVPATGAEFCLTENFRPVALDSYPKVTHFTMELPQSSTDSFDQNLSLHFHTQPNEEYSGQSTTCCLDSPVAISEESKSLPSLQEVPAHHPDESRGSHSPLVTDSQDSNSLISTDMLYVNVDNLHPRKLSMTEELGTASFDSALLGPPSSLSPQSSLSSSNVSPNTSFTLPTYHLPRNGSSDVHVTADFFIPDLDNLAERFPQQQRGSRDFYGELREFLSSSSSGTRSSGSGGGPNSSSNSTWGSRSGSISSHGTNGSSNDFMEFWNHLRRRSSQFSDTTSRRSSSSKHSSDFSTDLEEISESLQKHCHGVIEEEGGILTMLTDYASQMVTSAVRNGVATGVNTLAQPGHQFILTGSQETSEMGLLGEPGNVPKNASSPPRHRKTFSRAGTLVRQEKVNLEVDDAECKIIPGLEEESERDEYPQAQDSPPKIFYDFDLRSTQLPNENLSLKSSQQPNENLSLKSSQQPNENLSLKSSQQPNENLSLKSSQLPNEILSLKSSQQPNEILSPTVEITVVFSAPIPTSTKPSYSAPGYSVLYSRNPGKGSCLQSADSGFVSIQSSVASMSSSRDFHAPSQGVIASDPPGITASDLPGVSASHLPGDTASVLPGITAIDLPGVTISGQPGVTASGDMTRKSDETTSSAPEADQSKTCDIPVFKPEVTAHHKCLAHDKVPEIKKDSAAASSTSTISKPSISVHYVNMPQEAVKFDMKQSSTQKIHRTSHVARVTSHGTTKEVPPKSIKHGTLKTPEWPAARSKQTKVPEPSERDAEAVSASSTESIPHLSSGASGPTKSSGIPKFRSPSKKSCDPTKCLVPDYSHGRSRQADKSDVLPCSADREKVKMCKSKKQSARERDEKLFRAHRSRYVFSDVAAPPRERRSRHLKESTPESPHKRHGRGGSKKNEEKRRSKHAEEPVKEQARDLTKSPRFIRFVNTLAEMSLSQAVLEGAEIVSQTPFFQEEISDEVYNWFANKIITEVFFHVITELESRDDDQDQDRHASLHLEEIGASGGVDSQADSILQPLGASARDSIADEAGSARPKSKGILPSKSDTAASGVSFKSATGLQRSSGSLKMVKFKEGVEEDTGCSSSKLAHPQVLYTNHSKATAFQRMASSIPVPVRRRSSLDLPLTSPPTSRTTGDLSAFHMAAPLQPVNVPGQRRRSLTNADLSLDAYQAAASIVSQVFQTISDSMDVQALSPGSSCYHGTISSSDTGAHSTGSRIHSHYDSFASNIFSSSSTKASESPRRARRSVSPSIGLFFRKPMSRETLTNAYLKVDHSPQIKTYERRSSEPCQTSVTLSLQAFNNNKFNGRTVEEKMKKLSRTDDDIGCGKTWRRGSLDGYSFDQRRNSCGFKDPVLSRFAEELMKADTSVPELVIVGSHASSSSTGSRRSSVSAFRDSTLANLENELLNTSFTSACSMSQSSRSHRRHPQLDRSRSRDSRQGKSDSSETEYWFPPPKFVGDEFQLEYNRQHSQEELQDYASYFAGRVVQEAVCVLRCDPDYMSREEQDVDMFAENLTDQIMRDALMATVHTDSSGCPTDTSGNSGSEEKLMSALWSMSTSNKPGQGGVCGPPTSRAHSKPRSIPQRKDSVPDISGKPHSSYSHRIRFGPSGERRTSSFSVPPSQQYLHPAFKPSSEAWGGARPKSSRSSQTAESYVTPTQTKRHSSPSPFQFCSSLSHTSPSTLQVPSKMSHRQYLSLETRSKSESGPRCSNRHLIESQQWKKPLRKKKAESHASVSSAELGSDETCSSLLSSSSSSSLSASSSLESIGPVSHADTCSSHIPTKRAQQTGHSGPQQPSNPQAKRRREEKSDGRAEDTGDLGQSVEQFADNLCSHVVTEALQQCKKNKWLRFLSYQRPIATGNWGCGAYQGNPQLKFVMQWIAASVARSPLLIYYSFGDPALTQVQDVTNMMSGLTVGQLASTLREYCNWVCFHSTPSSLSSSPRSSSKTSMGSHLPLGSHSLWQDQRNSQLPQPLFDFLLEKFSQQDAKR